MSDADADAAIEEGEEGRKDTLNRSAGCVCCVGCRWVGGGGWMEGQMGSMKGKSESSGV